MNIRDYIHIGLATLIAALLIKLFVLDAVMVTSPSMEQTLLVGDVVLVNKLVDTRDHRRLESFGAAITMPHLPFVGEIGRGDVIVFHFPGERDDLAPRQSTDYVKRLAGLPGDTVAIHAGELFINGSAVNIGWRGSGAPRFPSDFSDDRLFPRGKKQNLDFYSELIVPRAGDVITLQERTLPVYEKLIRKEGHAIERTPDGYRIDGKPAANYTVRMNYLFVLGDNDYESSDSRFWGFLPEENVIGKAALIYWSKRPGHGGHEDIWNELRTSVRWDRIGEFVR